MPNTENTFFGSREHNVKAAILGGLSGYLQGLDLERLS